MSTPILTTDTKNSGHILEQYADNRDGVRIVASKRNSKDFTRLTVKAYSRFWVNIEIDNVKNNRRTSEGFSVNKEQLELLISNLTELSKQLDY